MYVSLLVLGGLTSAIGLALVATGLTAHEAPLDPEFMTSGTIAIIGGLVLVGLGFAVRALQRIEALLAARAAPRTARPAETPAMAPAVPAAVAANPVAAAVAVAAVEQAVAPPRPVAPPKPKAEPRPQFAAPAAPPAVEEPAFERLRERFPTLVRFDTGLIADESYVAAPEVEPVAEEVTEVRSVSVAGRVNGTAAPVRAAARLDTTARRISAPPPPRQKASVFEAFWPDGQRPRRGGPPAAAPGVAQEIAAPAPAPARMEAAHHHQEPVAAAHSIPHPTVQEPSRDARHAAEERAADEAAMAGPVSVLKSGVVEGMAYTLYSDGSIEAQLPQGRLRFGSITELRHHIESDA
jgi:hypothetical protein